MVVHPSVPTKSVPEFIAYAKANPGRINMAYSTSGGTDHLAGELFKIMAGVDMVGVPYRGGGAALVTALVAGQGQGKFPAMASSIGYIRSDKLRPLAVTTASRWEGLPEVPSVSEFVRGYEASSWHGVGLPKTTSAGIIDKLNRGINAALADPTTKARLSGLGGIAFGGSAPHLARVIADDPAKWAKVLPTAHIKTGGSPPSFPNVPFGPCQLRVLAAPEHGRTIPTWAAQFCCDAQPAL